MFLPARQELAAELLLNSQQLVVLGQMLGRLWDTSFDLTSAETHYQISEEGVCYLSRLMIHHHTPAVGLGQLASGSLLTGSFNNYLKQNFRL